MFTSVQRCCVQSVNVFKMELKANQVVARSINCSTIQEIVACPNIQVDESIAKALAFLDFLALTYGPRPYDPRPLILYGPGPLII